MIYEIRLSGSGGQGLVLVGIILGEAATIHENLYAIQRQSYGPEARGGASRSDVIISDVEIEYPVIDEPDLLLTMSEEGYRRYLKKLKKDGILIIDQSLVSADPKDFSGKLYSLEFTKSARTIFNLEIVANIIALGSILPLIKIVSKESVMKVLEKRIPAKFLLVNQKALEFGISLIQGV